MRFIVALSAVLGFAGGGQQGIQWLKLDQAKANSAQTNKLILVHVACDPKTGMSSCGKSPSDKAFTDPSMFRRQDDFYFVRLCDKKGSQDVKASKLHEAIFLDSDGDEVYRDSFVDAGTLDTCMVGALRKYVAREVAWTASEPKLVISPAEGRKTAVIAFADEKKDSSELLKGLEDRTLVKYHERFTWVRVPFKRDSEEAKKWPGAVAQAPTLLVVDAKNEIVDKLSGKKTPKDLKAFLTRALAKLEKK